MIKKVESIIFNLIYYVALLNVEHGFVFILQPLLPSILTTADASQILQQFMKGKGRLGAKIFCESIVCSEKFVESCRTMFDSLMKSKAEKVRR